MSFSNDIFSVKGKVVMVTGGGKGIGKMISTGFVSAGAKVYIVSRDAKALAESAEELNKMGPGICEFIACDLSKYDAIIDLVAEFSKREKHLNVLVNNSGATWGATLEDYPEEAFSKVMMLNVQRVFTLTQKLVPLLLASHPVGQSEAGPWSDPARIINIGSVNGLNIPRLETYAYSASKAGLHHLSRVFAGHLGKRGITSNTLACGPFQSKMMAATLATAGDVVIGGVPLARIGSPEDVAGTCIFLSSRAGSYINGATIAVDGGSLCSTKL